MAPEIIKSDDVIDRGSIGRVETRGDLVKIYAAVAVVGLALVIGCITLVLSIVYQKPELQTWATSLVSSIVGAAIGFGFNSKLSG